MSDSLKADDGVCILSNILCIYRVTVKNKDSAITNIKFASSQKNQLYFAFSWHNMQGNTVCQLACSG